MRNVPDPKRLRRRVIWTIGIVVGIILLALVTAWWVMIRMPGASFAGALPPLSADDAALSAALRRDVTRLAGEIGPRNLDHPVALENAVDFIEMSFADTGFDVRRQTVTVGNRTCENLELEITGDRRSTEIVIVGAHYDTAGDGPGADDNASGIAALLALGREFAAHPPTASRTLRLVAFVNEEPPYFQTESMGSLAYARRCRERNEHVVAMLSLETVGFYSESANSQQYPAIFNLLYPSTGNFIAFVGNVSSRRLVRQAVGSFRKHAKFPSQGGAVPGSIIGVGWSDHWAFWQMGYPAVMLTDTAPFRNPHYHTRHDLPETLDYDRMARVVRGVAAVVSELLGDRPSSRQFTTE